VAIGDALPAQRPATPEHPAARLLPAAGQTGALNQITALAARLLGSPESPVSVQVSLLTDVQTVAAGTNLGPDAVGGTGPLADSLCTVAVANGAPLVVSDATADDRVAELPPVTTGAVRSYLGVPLAAQSGSRIGALCAFAPEARSWTVYDVALLEELAGAVMAQLELQAITSEYESSRVRWDVAIEAAGIGTFDWDLLSNRLDWDERMQTLFGYEPGQFVPHIDAGFARVHADDRPAVEAAIDAALACVGDYRADFRVVLPDGQIRWAAARGRALPGPDGAAARLVGTAYDVTEIRTARDEAARLLETMATGFVSIDRDWRITYLNRAGERVVGMAAEAVVGQDLWEVFPGLDELEFGRLYRQAMTTGEVGEVEAYYPHLSSWFQVRVEPDARGLALYFLDVSARRADQERAQAANQRLELLATVSAELAAAGLQIEEAVARFGEVVTPLLADWCLVSMVDGDRIRDVGFWHSDPELRPVLADYVDQRLVGRDDPGAVERVKATGRPVIVESGLRDSVLPTLGTDLARSSWIALDPESLVVVPLHAHDQLIGILSLVRGPGRPPMSAEEITTAREVAARAGLALDNARLYAEQHNLAEGLQRSLLTTPPEPDHCEITVRYVPAAQAASVGGDWFDSFLQRDGATVLVIGDVMGHDTVAAAAMGQLRGLLRGIAWHSGAAPAEVLSGLDAAMQGLQVNTTATAVVARLEQSLDERDRGVTRLRWSNAGHPPPMAINPDGSVIALVGVGPDLLLGIDPETPRTESAVVLDRQSTVLLYTDGLVERRDQDLDEGLALLRDTLGELAHLPLEDLCEALLQRMVPGDPDDDVALVAVRLHRQDLPRPAEAGPQRVPPEVPPEPEL
jgi:PAS domain S-box-containing protein